MQDLPRKQTAEQVLSHMEVEDPPREAHLRVDLRQTQDLTVVQDRTRDQRVLQLHLLAPDHTGAVEVRHPLRVTRHQVPTPVVVAVTLEVNRQPLLLQVLVPVRTTVEARTVAANRPLPQAQDLISSSLMINFTAALLKSEFVS